MRMRYILNGLLALAVMAETAMSQLPEGEQELREAHIQRKSAVGNMQIKPIWADDSSSMFYRIEAGESWEWLKARPATGTVEPAFDHAAMAKALKGEVGRLSIEEVRQKGEEIEVKSGGKWMRWDGSKLTATAPTEKSKASVKRPEFSPDERWRVELRAHNVILHSVEDNVEEVMTSDGDATHMYGHVQWAPDSSRFVVWKTKVGQRRQVTVVESSPKDQLQPKVHTFAYDKPGDRIDTSAPYVFFTDKRAVIKPDHSLIKNPFQVNKLVWRGDSQRLTYHYIERGFGKHNVIEVNTETRVQRVLVREESETFIHVWGIGFREDLNDGKEILWTSERDGWNHLYLLDGKTGEVKRQLTKGDWVVHKVAYVNQDERYAIVVGGGKLAGRDPYHKHWYKVDLDTAESVHLTPQPGTHKLTFSADRKYYLDTYSSIDRAPTYELRKSADGSLVKLLHKVSTKELEATGWRAPIVFKSKDRDGKFDIWGSIELPVNFDPQRSYPVIENIYAGPHDQHVPKRFSVWNGNTTDLTQRGFIVVRIDGKGTGKRCKEFSHFCYKNLADAGFPDRIAWMRDAAKKIPQMDLQRVGIYGGSAGGQSSTGALLSHGDFYKAAVSDCGCHDNRMDKIWWNEQWMDWPVGPHYAEQSNVTNAHKLKGHLLLTVGELDRNVDPASTTQVADALIKAQKDFKLIVIPGGGHGSGEKLFPKWQRIYWFEKHLGGVKELSD